MSVAEIKSTKELKREIKKINSKWSNTDGSDQAVIDEALKLINSFEAGVRERFKKLERMTTKGKWTTGVSELRRLLEGEGGEKGDE